MALFHAITTPADLPPEGTSRESGTFDFKGKQDPADQDELAKDIAAFANALGGVVLVGALEDQKRGALGTYKPIARVEDAEDLRRAYELAAAQWCDPQPVVAVARIETDIAPAVNKPGHVVAVNVYAAPMGPIGVRRERDAYAFPLRTATQTHWLKPTELAMLMVPEIRRVAILLDRIPREQRHNVWLYSSTHISTAWREVSVLGIDDFLTTLTVVEANPPNNAPTPVTIPLDQVASVWQRTEKTWCISVRGSFMEREGRVGYLPGW